MVNRGLFVADDNAEKAIHHFLLTLGYTVGLKFAGLVASQFCM